VEQQAESRGSDTLSNSDFLLLTAENQNFQISNQEFLSRMQLYLGTSVYGYSDGRAVTTRLWPKFIQCRRHFRTECHSISNPTGTGL
jgi:hypothetical protein